MAGFRALTRVISTVIDGQSFDTGSCTVAFPSYAPNAAFSASAASCVSTDGLASHF